MPSVELHAAALTASESMGTSRSAVTTVGFAEKQHNLALGSQESTFTVLQMVGGLWESKVRCTDTIPNTSECHGVMGADRNN